MPDKYPDFKTLSKNEIEEQDFCIRIMDVKSPVTIVAPHGGRIEPGTCKISEWIAGNVFNCYCFKGIKKRFNRDLHITSHRFDEPRVLELISKSRVVLTIHATKDKDKRVYLGGRHKTLCQMIFKALAANGIACRTAPDKFKGMHLKNICNLGIIKKGVQLEISRGLRDDVLSSRKFASLVQNVLIDYLKSLG